MKLRDSINPDHYKRGNIEAIEAIKESMTEEAYLEQQIDNYNQRRI